MPHVNKTKIQTFSAFYLILLSLGYLIFSISNFIKTNCIIGLTVKKKLISLELSFIRTFNRKNFSKSKSSIYVHIN